MSTYSSVTSLLSVFSDSTSMAVCRSCRTVSSRRSAGTLNAMKPRCFSLRLDETTQPPMSLASCVRLSIDAETSPTLIHMSTVRTMILLWVTSCATASSVKPGEVAPTIAFIGGAAIAGAGAAGAGAGTGSGATRGSAGSAGAAIAGAGAAAGAEAGANTESDEARSSLSAINPPNAPSSNSSSLVPQAARASTISSTEPVTSTFRMVGIIVEPPPQSNGRSQAS